MKRSYLSAVLLTLCMAGGQSPPSTEYRDRFATVNGLRIHYLDWGSPDKPPLIMLHGIGRVAHSFDHIAPRFRSGYHVIAMDPRGHGDSAWSPEGAYLVEDYAKDLEAFVEQLNLRGLTLLGNSTGGRVVQVYAGLHPDRMARLVVEDVGPERTNEIASGFARRVEQEDKGWASADELVACLRRGGNRLRGAAAKLRAFREQAARGRPHRLEARPQPGQRFRADRAVAIRSRNQIAHHLYIGRPQHDCACRHTGRVEEGASSGADLHRTRRGALPQRGKSK